MRKWLASLSYILTILVAIVLLAPALLGLFAEKKCKQLITVINESNPLISAKIINYQRGWFGAKAIAQISLDKLDLPHKELYQLTLTANITHGPLIIDWTKFKFAQAAIDTDIVLNETQNNWLKRDPHSSPVANLKIRFKLNGSTDIALYSHALNYHNEGNNIDWHGLKMRWLISPFYNQIKSTIDFSGAAIKTKDCAITIGEITGSYQGAKATNGIWLGERNLQFIAFSTTNKNNHTIAFSNFNLHNIVANHESNLANLATTITIDNLSINGADYNKSKFDFEITRLDQTLLRKLETQLLSGNLISSPISATFDSLMSLLNNHSEINIKQLDTVTPWGELLATIKIANATQASTSGILAMVASSMVNTKIKAERALVSHLLEKFYQNIPTKQPSDPTQQAEKLLTAWQYTGKITASKEDPYLHLNLDYQNNQLLLNGKELTLTIKP